jgi:nicotinate-nucleotide adenylyltransferase
MTPALAAARTGVLGGTFNPIHLGHLRAAEEVREALGLARVIFVPSAEPPHKLARRGDPIAPAACRLDWVRRAVADHPQFSVDPIEVERGGPSYLVDTLRAIARVTRPERPVFLVGQDAFREIDGWREPEALLALAHFAVIPRPPLPAGRLADWLPARLRDLYDGVTDAVALHRSAGTWIQVVPVRALDISATDVRARLRAGRSVRYLLPEAVREAVLKSEVYGPRPAEAGGGWRGAEPA